MCSQYQTKDASERLIVRSMSIERALGWFLVCCYIDIIVIYLNVELKRHWIKMSSEDFTQTIRWKMKFQALEGKLKKIQSIKHLHARNDYKTEEKIMEFLVKPEGERRLQLNNK